MMRIHYTNNGRKETINNKLKPKKQLKTEKKNYKKFIKNKKIFLKKVKKLLKYKAYFEQYTFYIF